MYTPEYRLQECAFADPIFAHDTDSFSGIQMRFSNIEQWFCPPDKCIFDLEYIFWSTLFRYLESESDSSSSSWPLDDVDFFERSFPTFCESCTRSSTESIDQYLLSIEIDLLLFEAFFLTFFDELFFDDRE